MHVLRKFLSKPDNSQPQPPSPPVSDADDEAALSAAEEKFYSARPISMMWRKFRRHKLAQISLYFLLFMYALVLFPEFFAPMLPDQRYSKYFMAPPQPIRFIDAAGNLRSPFVYGIDAKVDMDFNRTYIPDETKVYPISLFVQADPYRLWGLFPMDIHLFGADPQAPMYLLGTDRLGRDVFSRTIYGTRLSLTLGLVGITISFFLGIILGGISGYFGGVVDTIIQRIIEILRSFPSLPLWMALSAAMPNTWSVPVTYFALTVILSVLGWTGMARVVRGKFLSLREEGFVRAARLSGASTAWIIRKHLVPSFMSHLIASATLSIPGMIIAETTLSFLGLGLRPPALSWGVMIKDAQNIQVIMQTPWLLLPAVLVTVSMLAFNFFGDGLRDAADPYR